MIAETSVEKLIAKHGPMTRAEAHRVLVQNFDAANLSVKEISRRIGITPDRVEQILDQLDGMPHEDAAERAPSVEPIHGAPKVVHAEPSPRPAARKPVATHGTYSGYNKHAQSIERPGDWSRKPCESCAEARRKYQSARKASGRPAAKPPLPPTLALQAGGIVSADTKVRVTLGLPDESEVVIPLSTRRATARIIRRREYGLGLPSGEIAPTTGPTAEIAARNGVTVYRRTVTEWEQVSP